MSDKTADFNYFLQQLKRATARVDSQYFNFHVTGVDNTIFRERVYCYELYHQLRCILGDTLDYKLQGEVDKRGSSPELKETKPDFIFHVPGTKNNLAVIEVKSISNDDSKIKEDIDKFKKFLDYGYYQAIMLIYGDDENKIEHARKEIDSLQKKYSKHIVLLWHKEHGAEAKVK